MSKRILFAECGDELYIRVDAIMPILCAVVDGLPLTFFNKKRSKPFMKVSAAIEWCQNEALYHSAERYRKLVEWLQKERDRFDNLHPIRESLDGTESK